MKINNKNHKSLSQIRAKINSLKKKLSKQRITETFGEKDIRRLNDFVGNTWEYGENKNIVEDMILEFIRWCENFELGGSI